MPQQIPNPIELAFPLSGVDRSLPARQQLALTTYELLNVRAFPPSSDRLGGGSREGMSKLLSDQAGTTDDRRIQGVDVLTEAAAITDPNQFSSVALLEDWSTQATADPANLGVNWHPIRIGSTSAPSAHTHFSISGSTLVLDSSTNSAIELVLSAYYCDTAVGVTSVITASRTAATSSDGYAAAGQVSNVGPILGVSNAGTQGVFACFVATGADTVQAKIYEFTNLTLIQKATSGDLVLDGTGTSSDYTIALTIDGGTVEAVFTATGVLVAAANIDETLTYATTQTGKRGGVAVKPRTSASNLTNQRVVKSVSLTQLHPPANTVFSSIDPAAANPIDANQFYLPAGWVGVERSAAGALTVTAGGPTSGTDPNWLAINDTANTLSVTNPNPGNSSFPEYNNFALYQDTTNAYGLNLRMDLANYASNDDNGSPIFRASADGRNALILKLYVSANTTTGMVIFQGVNGIAIIDNVVTYLGGLSGVFDSGFFHGDGDYRFTDDGTNILLYINGILVDTIDPSSFGNWTSEIATALSSYIGVGVSGGVNASGTSFIESFMGKSEVVQGEVAASINVSNVKNKMAIYSPAKVQIGDTSSLTLVDVTGPVMSNPLPSSSSFNRKFYAVDGNDEIIIDPATNTAIDWAGAVTDGTLPALVRHCRFFRGSAYLAATPSDPTIWFKSRTLDPLDWDYGADPQVSSAVAGNNGSVGQPADAITALVPFADDYMLFGMARSLGVLVGDPGYGGQFQIASNEAGIVGPRAVCFDDRGNLFFVGAGGLYMMLKGGFLPEPVGPRKLRRVLEELDIDSNLVQVAYRASDRTVRIYVTPTNGETIGTHIVYDTRTEGFFFDQIPLEFGPWSIAQTNGVLDIDRNLVIGCNDGYIRRPDDSVFSDDGTAIASQVEIVIPEAQKGTAETICQELQFVLGEGGDTITWRWFSGRSPEEVRLQTVGSEIASGTITGTGFKTPIGLRAAGAAHKLRLEASSSTAQWCLERVIAMMSITTDRRR